MDGTARAQPSERDHKIGFVFKLLFGDYATHVAWHSAAVQGTQEPFFLAVRGEGSWRGALTAHERCAREPGGGLGAGDRGNQAGKRTECRASLLF